LKHFRLGIPCDQEELNVPESANHAPRVDRRAVDLNGYVVRSNKTIVDVKVLDLSYDGCAIKTHVPLAAGEKVKLSALGRGSTAATVRWYKARKAGLLFDSANSQRTNWPRQADRNEVEGEASLRRVGRLSYRVLTFDVTRFGCRCEFVERPAIYERLWVKFDGLESLESTVCWVEDSCLGLMYENPLHPAVLDMLVARQKPKPPSSA
jgi:hypothetical protein